jgi:hypothetical protein
MVSSDELPQSIKQKIGIEKLLVSLPWSIHEIHGLFDAPKGTTHNTALFIDAVLLSLIENTRLQTDRMASESW